MSAVVSRVVIMLPKPQRLQQSLTELSDWLIFRTFGEMSFVDES